MRLVLCGLPGAGKSTLGLHLSKSRNVPFFDLDHQIGDPKEAYNRLGEMQFREMEARLFQEFHYPKSCLISLGGGTLDLEENRIFAKKLGKILYLKSSLATLFTRLSARGFPSYFQKDDPFFSLKMLAEKRCPLFESVSDIEIDAQLPTSEQIKKIARLL